MAQALQVARFLISGGTAAFVHVSLTYIFTEYVGWWYVVSAGAGFLVAYVVSFMLQKYWTFGDHSSEGILWQAMRFLLVGFFGLSANIIGIHLLTEAGMYYLFSQIIVIGLVAITSFVIYKTVIFPPREEVGDFDNTT